MLGKRHSDEDIMKLLREIEVKLSAGSNVMQQRHAATKDREATNKRYLIAVSNLVGGHSR